MRCCMYAVYIQCSMHGGHSIKDVMSCKERNDLEVKSLVVRFPVSSDLNSQGLDEVQPQSPCLGQVLSSPNLATPKPGNPQTITFCAR